MKENCFRPEELSRFSDLPEGDPRLSHLDNCPRCRALLAAYGGFMTAADEVPEDADIPDANLRLTTALDSEIFGDAAPRVTPVGATTPVGRLFRIFKLRPAYSLAGLLAVVIGGGWLLLQAGGEGDPQRLRGHGETSTVGGFDVSAPRLVRDGEWQLSWQAFEGADAYEMHFYSTDLEELAHLPPSPDTTRSITLDDLGAGTQSGRTVLWRVVALSKGDPLATSAIGTLHLP